MSDINQELSLAFLGAGIFAREAYLPALESLGATRPVLKAVYSRSEASARNLAETAAARLNLSATPDIYYKNDLGDLLARNDIDAVLIMLPISLQPKIILEALGAGKHVLSEKPVAKDVATGVGLVKTYLSEYKPKGLVWRVAENYEAEPAHRMAANAIQDGKIGRVMFVNANVLLSMDQDSKWYQTSWRMNPDYQGGFLLDGGVHTAAALRTILPTPITHVFGVTSQNRPYLPPCDTLHAVFKSSSNYDGCIQMTFAHPKMCTSTSDHIVVTGTHGRLSVTDSSLRGSGKNIIQVKIDSTVQGTEKGDECRKTVIDVPERGVEEELESFLLAVRGKDDGLGDPEGALKDVAFIQAALNSRDGLVDLAKLISQSE